MSLRKSSSGLEPTKTRKQRNQTVYHETYLMSIPRPATSVATRMSLAPALRLDNANSLKRKPTKWVFMTGSELRCRCYVTAYVRLSWRTNETECRDAWQKCLQGLIKQTTSGSSCLPKKEGPDWRLSLTELFNLKTVFFFVFISYCLNCNYHFDDHISIKFVLRQFTSSFMFHSFHRWRWTQQIGLLPIYGSS